VIAAVTAIAAFPLGFLLRSRAHANTTYAIAYLWAFTFQTLYLVLPGFQGPNPDNPFPVGEFPLTYGLVASSVLAVGLVLVEAGHRIGVRRRAHQDSLAVETSPASTPTSRPGRASEA
jgi:hypothetical protein